MEKNHRRRGKELENAILDAAWQTMQAQGYAQLTMDDIAAAAHTNKNAIYRRWDTKLAVISDAGKRALSQGNYVSPLTFVEPNTGKLRDDLIALLSIPLPITEQIGRENLKAFIQDYLPHLTLKTTEFLLSDSFLQRYLTGILDHAYARGDIPTAPADIPVVVKRQPAIQLLANILSDEPYDTATIVLWVDRILLPLFKTP
ncbi:helix-turn-helix domain-containing protein [Levilactobacillus fujinensis]|uniref:Helix-turn-helix domain-containing protein n=1 Tax=Levilactobacillus fujinensis TaxID=2486024 RepID=A0ABW1TFP2_9LACO|nr:TetR/AcrR family transcriptional regulator [Levilactobacillus fujinensis]